MEKEQSNIDTEPLSYDTIETDELRKSIENMNTYLNKLEKQNDELSKKMDKSLELIREGNKIRQKQLITRINAIIIIVMFILLIVLFDVHLLY